ncbi:hypothetical protein ABZW18_14855 [Streptomyces sp. NPDC004647]|uniref:hypothetical protein n=1 Tax=Streptomyces sp. NPDC004647 TaxID=3154671 RepID=UPI0033A2CFF7
MATSPLDPLQLSRYQVRIAADFHESYAELVLREAESVRREEGPRREPPAAFVEAASAYRLAGQWRLLIDPAGARGPLLRAADLLTAAGLAFGAFLRASVEPAGVEPFTRSAWMRRLVQHGSVADTIGREEGPADDLLGHAQQQAYLLLACAALNRPGYGEAERLASFAAESPHLRGVVPMGSLGMPVRMFWSLALNLLDRHDDRAASSYLATLSELSRRTPGRSISPWRIR